MLTLEQMKKLLEDPSIPDNQVLEIRDQLYSLAEIIFEQWQIDMAKEKKRRLEEKAQKENMPANNPE
ncbi:MAG TPA: hypothetical protein P5548_00065 [Candidatus Moranbacteria bacterium]|nr:hypothetical protein [Candidatus Moranbacteria bacterium]HRZ33287.1 hypothetical protein [Candidatus Moranbacteria bacterium]